MKKLATFMMAAVLILSPMAVTGAYAAEAYKESPIDQAGDWFATLGKQGLEKDRILTERKAQRAAKYAEKQAKQAAKEAEAAAKDAKKKLGF